MTKQQMIDSVVQMLETGDDRFVRNVYFFTLNAQGPA